MIEQEREHFILNETKKGGDAEASMPWVLGVTEEQGEIFRS